MNRTDSTYRRGFLGRVLGVAAAGFMSVGAAEAQTKGRNLKARKLQLL